MPVFVQSGSNKLHAHQKKKSYFFYILIIIVDFNSFLVMQAGWIWVPRGSRTGPVK